MKMDKKIYIRPESYNVEIGKLMDDPVGETTDLPITSGNPIDASQGQAKQVIFDDFSFEENDIQWSDTVIDWKNVRFKL